MTDPKPAPTTAVPAAAPTVTTAPAPAATTAPAPGQAPAPTTASAAAPLEPPPPPVALADPAVRDALDRLNAARAGLAQELTTLEASTRAALDIKAKVKRNPGKTAAAVGGTAFVVVGGPKKVFRAVKSRIVGKPDPLPPSLLPEQIDRAVRALGDDGAKVRGALEREFADYVAEGRRQDIRFTRRLVLATAAPLATTAIREVVKRLASAPPEEVERREADIRARVDRARGSGG